MEVIKKKFQIVTTTGTTTGCTGNCYVIIPYSGTGVTYNFNVLLKATANDWGFFDTLSEGQDLLLGNITCDALSAATSGTSECDTGYTFSTGATISAGTYTVTGTSSSRLNELRKFSTSGSLSQLYFTSTTPTSDGVDTGQTVTGTTASTYVYYISGITYQDDIVSGESTVTTFSFESSGLTSPVFDNLPIIKKEENITAKPIVSSDVFIIRDENSAFEKNYRLRNINNITELQYYAGGAYFNIVENT